MEQEETQTGAEAKVEVTDVKLTSEDDIDEHTKVHL